MWFVQQNASRWERGKRLDLDREPAPTIQAHGIAGCCRSHYYWLEEGDAVPAEATTVGEKPAYQVPTMPEIAAVPSNGRTMVSTFSGCGGSCLGFRMAGFRVAWASEFVPAAAEVYRLNHPTTILSTDDIREVTGPTILDAIGMRAGELDVLEGSPPCASFSTAGRRQRHWGEERKYSDRKQRVDDLFFEFARILGELQPRAFVAENVSGLVRGVAKGYFKEILAALGAQGYDVKARLLDAQWLGVPQQRQRIIFVGARRDLAVEPRHPTPLPYRYTVREAIPWLSSVRSQPHGPGSWQDESVLFTRVDQPAPAVQTGPNSGAYYRHEVEELADAERAFQGAISGEAGKLRPGEVSRKYLSLIRSRTDGPSPTVTAEGGKKGVAGPFHPTERRKFTIAELRRLCAFPDDFELTGTYAQQWERLGRAVPPVMMSHVAREVAAMLDEADGRSA